jgi:hypothetical protein
MLLGVDEFQQEQGFHVCKHRLELRLRVGHGLQWGRDFAVDDVKGTVAVGPFYAVDELGRELWVRNACTIDLAQWLTDSGVKDGATVYVVADYQPCSVAPVPAVAAPCDDAIAPTMPSRLLETATVSLVLDRPVDPIDFSSGAWPGPAPADVALRFESLVQLIRDDESRPLLLGSFKSKVATGVAGKKTVTTNQVTAPPGAPLPRFAAFHVVAIDPILAPEPLTTPVTAPTPVTPSTPDAPTPIIPPLPSAAPHLPQAAPVSPALPAAGRVPLETPVNPGAPRLRFQFSRPIAVAPVEAFRIEEITPPETSGGLFTLRSLVDPAHSRVYIDRTDHTAVSVTLSTKPHAGRKVRVAIAGSGVMAVLDAETFAPLNDGIEFITILQPLL